MIDPGLVFASVLADTLWGGRFYRWHPVRTMGAMGRILERAFFGWTENPLALRLLGVVLVVAVSGTFGFGCALALRILSEAGLAPVGAVLTVAFGYLLLAGRSLETHVRDVLVPLEREDLPGARRALSAIVGRDTERLDAPGVIRGAIESLSENANDALVAPLVYFFLGGLPGLMGYKAVSTMDSQVGYKAHPYRDLGWSSARLDDLLAFVPARITLVVLVVLFGPTAAAGRKTTFMAVVREAWRYRMCHPSPNSGLPMSSFAALLDVRLGGGAYYNGRWVEKPWIGDGRSEPTLDDLRTGLRIFRRFRWGICLASGLVALLPLLVRVEGHLS